VFHGSAGFYLGGDQALALPFTQCLQVPVVEQVRWAGLVDQREVPQDGR
jgi:hypothetical protein